MSTPQAPAAPPCPAALRLGVPSRVRRAELSTAVHDGRRTASARSRRLSPPEHAVGPLLGCDWGGTKFDRADAVGARRNCLGVGKGWTSPKGRGRPGCSAHPALDTQNPGDSPSRELPGPLPTNAMPWARQVSGRGRFLVKQRLRRRCPPGADRDRNGAREPVRTTVRIGCSPRGRAADVAGGSVTRPATGGGDAARSWSSVSDTAVLRTAPSRDRATVSASKAVAMPSAHGADSTGVSPHRPK